MVIRFHVKNWIPRREQSTERVVTVDVPADLAPTDAKVIDWLKRQQPYLIETEKWEVVKTEQIKEASEAKALPV